MSWSVTTDLSAFTARARPLLEADPVANTLPLTIIGDLLAGRHFSDLAPVFLIHETSADSPQASGTVDGAAVMTPPHPLVLAENTDVSDLVHCLIRAGVQLSGVNGPADAARRVARAWSWARGTTVTAAVAEHLLLLTELRAAAPPPVGFGRPAKEADTALVGRWLTDFAAEAHGSVLIGGHTIAARRIAQQTLWCWCAPTGEPMSLAAYSPAIAGVSRIGPVYTPPERRRLGYAAAVTTAATRAAQAHGASQVCLFTDAANATSNALYERLGYRRIGGRLVLSFRDRGAGPG